MLIIDNYIFDKNVWESNLIELLKVFGARTPVKFNLLIVSFEGSKFKIDINIGNDLKNKLIQCGINCNLCIILAPTQLKEHDRTILTNYLRIKSGDSFNYFNSNGDYITKGTEIVAIIMIRIVVKSKGTPLTLYNNIIQISIMSNIERIEIKVR